MPCRWFFALGGRKTLGPAPRFAQSRQRYPRIWTAARAGAEIPQEQGKVLWLSRRRRSLVRQAPNQGSSPVASGARPFARTTDRVTATPQCLQKRSAFGNLMAALFICCGAGTYFVHLSFRVKSAFALKS